MSRRLVLIFALLIGQTSVGIFAFITSSDGDTHVAAAGNHTIAIGPGFTDVSPHQLVRTSANILYTVAPTCDAYPSCPGNSLRVYRADQAGTPTTFSEQDAAHRPANVGSSAIAIDGTDTVHVLWNDRAGNVNYRTFSPTNNLWSNTTVVATTNWTDFGQGDEGVALAVDSNGMPHAAWSAKGSDSILHVYYGNKGGSWSAQQVDDIPLSNNRRTLHPTVAFTATNALVVSWLEGTFNYVPDGIIRLRTRSSAGTWATTQTINDPDGAMTTIDNGPSLLITPDGTIHLTFLAANPADQVRYWYNSGAGWQGDRQPPAQITHDPSLGPDGNGGVFIYGHGTPTPVDGHGDNLYSFHKAAGATTWEPWTLYVTGSYDSSVSTRWAQFFHTFPQEIDIVYWADAYPNNLSLGTDTIGGGTATPTPAATATMTPTTIPPTATSTATASPTATSVPATPTTVPTPTPTATPTTTATSTSTPAPTATRRPGSLTGTFTTGTDTSGHHYGFYSLAAPATITSVTTTFAAGTASATIQCDVAAPNPRHGAGNANDPYEWQSVWGLTNPTGSVTVNASCATQWVRVDVGSAPPPTAMSVNGTASAGNPTPTASPTVMPPPTALPTSSPTIAPTPTSTSVPTATSTVPPTPTNTPVPTSTTVPPTPTPTLAPTPTAAASPTPTSTPAGSTLLIGRDTIGDQQDYTIPGTANAFQVAAAAGTLNTLAIYLDRSSTATRVVLGVYSDIGGNPGTLLTQGTISSPANGAWNRVAVPTVNVTAGSRYWLVLLAPSGGGTFQFWEQANGGVAIVSAQTTLTSLPSTWQSGERYQGSPPTAYGASG